MTLIVKPHIWKQANDKKLPHGAIQQVLEGKSATFYTRKQGLGKCKFCGNDKHELNGIGQWEGKRYALGIVICPNCEIAITVYQMNNEGCTPIRPDQWARGERRYIRSCGDCGKSFTITAQTWEKLHEQTAHKCRNGKRVDLISDEHKGLTGKYHPKG